MNVFRYASDLGDLNKALGEASEIKKDRFKYSELGKNKTVLLIFFNNSLRTRLSTQKAAMNLGMNVIVLDINRGAWKLETRRGVVMDDDKSEHLLEAVPVMAQYCDLIGVRTFARFESREADYTEEILNQFLYGECNSTSVAGICRFDNHRTISQKKTTESGDDMGASPKSIAAGRTE